MGSAFSPRRCLQGVFAARRWPNGEVICPRCGSVDRVFALKTMPFNWECMNCGKSTSYRFSVLVDTIFENTNIGLPQWFKVIYLMLTSKKGISSLQIQRIMGFGSYKTALYMCTASGQHSPTPNSAN